MRFIVATARSPFSHERVEEKDVIRHNVGGVATALRRVMIKSGGTWICWGDGTHDRDYPEEYVDGYKLVRVFLDKNEKRGFYDEYSNRTLWPLFHYFRDRIKFKPKSFEQYVNVNRKFAEKIVQHHHEDAVIWVHDYQLSLVPGMLKMMLPDAFIATTWHIPWVAGEFFSLLPRSRELFNSLSQSDLIMFHTDLYSRNFVNTQTEQSPALPDLKSRVVTIPLGIDEKYYSKAEKTENHISNKERKVIFSIDRLDYTKGLVHKVFAIEELLRKHPDLEGRFVYVMFVTPSRTSVREYQVMKSELEMNIGRVNGKFGTMDWMPILYIYRKVTDSTLKLHYRTADAALITPLMDGLNLVAKEFVAASENGVLIISRFAGASHDLKQALVVNPYNRSEVAESIYRALNMSASEKRIRLMSLKHTVWRKDVNWWIERVEKEVNKRRFNVFTPEDLVDNR